jgi:hypothetical protein
MNYIGKYGFAVFIGAISRLATTGSLIAVLSISGLGISVIV